MSEISVYSVAIYPVLSVMEKVKAMKDELASVAGWYSSRNSKAHITICEFNVIGERELLAIKSQLLKLCTSEPPLDLTFDRIDVYENGVICILPDKESEIILKQCMKRIQQGMKVKLTHRSYNPHISIGRRLNHEQLSLARDLFMDTKVNLNFICDRIVLRVRVNEGQFVVIGEFVFQSNSQSRDEQLSMF